MKRESQKSVTICHFSDLHLRLESRVPLSSLLGKRSLGYANLAFNRGRTHKRKWLESLIRAVAAEKADLVVVTGDLTSLSLDFEFKAIDRMFREGGLSPDNTVVIPGNHDRYTFLADKGCAFEQGMKDWLPEGFCRKIGYPVVRSLGPVVLAALDTAVWRNPVRAGGVLHDDQLARLAEALDREGNRWPLVALHHAPFHRGNKGLLHYRTGLEGYEKLPEIFGGRGGTLIHGHLHLAIQRTIGKLNVFGVSSASNNTGERETQLAYNLYTFTDQGHTATETVRLWPGDTSPSSPVERSSLL